MNSDKRSNCDIYCRFVIANEQKNIFSKDKNQPPETSKEASGGKESIRKCRSSGQSVGLGDVQRAALDLLQCGIDRNALGGNAIGWLAGGD